MASFIQVYDLQILDNIAINVDWIKAVIPKPPVQGEGCFIVVGDGYYYAGNPDDLMERYNVRDTYAEIMERINHANHTD